MGAIVLMIGPEAKARGGKNLPGPEPKSKGTKMANIVNIPIENLAISQETEQAEPMVGDMVELTGEVVEIKEGVAMVRVSEAEGEMEEESPEAETEGERLRNEAVKMDGGEMMED
jgi:hypothetical protein